MKQIQPVIFPLNLGTATILNCVGSDNFSTSVTIYYQLLTETSQDGNEYIYQWSAQQIGVTLI